MITVNNERMDEGMMNKLVEFNSKFSKYTFNYTLLFIFHIPNKEQNYHNFTYSDNIHFLELHTLSYSNGVEFGNNEDNNYLDTIINGKYVFDVKNLDDTSSENVGKKEEKHEIADNDSLREKRMKKSTKRRKQNNNAKYLMKIMSMFMQ
jgi:hypothetical protein